MCYVRLLVAALLILVSTTCSAAIQPADLRCEYLTDPLGIDVTQPRLSWILSSEQRGERQTAYRVLVSGSEEVLKAGRGDLWDTGKVASDETVQIAYAGKPLRSRQRCFWKVQVWDRAGKPAPWSALARWEMGLLQPVDWKAKWIGAPTDKGPDSPDGEPSPYFRRKFNVAKAVKSARAYVCGLGLYELSLNGRKVGDYVLSPNQTDYDVRNMRRLLYPFDDNTTKRTLYVTYDITKQLHHGPNAVGIVLGDGWYNQRARKVEGWMWYGPPKAIAQVEVTYTDGTRQVVGTGGDWKFSTGPILQNSIFVGEVYDARRELGAWDRPGYDDRKWTAARVVSAPAGPLRAQMGPPDRVIQTISPVTVNRDKQELRVLDFGENITGWVRIRVVGSAGTMVTMRYREELGEDYGQVDTYTLKGDGVEIYEPRFTWHGFRTVEVTGLSIQTQLLEAQARVVHTDVKPAGTFKCSNDLLNRIQANFVRTQMNNMHMGVPSDCPHRERLGYTGDGQIAAEAALYNLDMPAFYTKWIADVRDAQNKKTGFVPHTAPFGGGGGGPAWGSAAAIMPWNMYLYYGDKRMLNEYHASMKRWVEYLETRTDGDHIVVREEPGGWCLGDWATPTKVEVPPELVNSCYYARVANMVADTSAALSNFTESDRYRELARDIAANVHRKFFNPITNQYSIGRQGANLFPLGFGLVPVSARDTVFENVVRNVEKNGGHLDTGILGTPLLLDVLTTGGRADLAYGMVSKTTHPSWGYAVSKGATTIWESWNGDGSHSHPMYGSVSAWFYQRLAGIMPDPSGPGFKKIIIRPEPVGDLTRAEAEYHSVRGRILSRWLRDDKRFRLTLVIPPGTTATLYLPGSDPAAVTEFNTPVSAIKEVKFLRSEGGRLVYAVESGTYVLTVVGGK
jgi:alpha-L-rhamnosidase